MSESTASHYENQKGRVLREFVSKLAGLGLPALHVAQPVWRTSIRRKEGARRRGAALYWRERCGDGNIPCGVGRGADTSIHSIPMKTPDSELLFRARKLADNDEGISGAGVRRLLAIIDWQQDVIKQAHDTVDELRAQLKASCEDEHKLAKEAVAFRARAVIDAELRTAGEEMDELRKDHRAMRSILLRIHSAKIAMNDDAMIKALDDIDAFFREQNTN